MINKTTQTTFKDITGNKMRKEKWTGDILRYYAEQMMLYPTNDEEILNIDMTNKFGKEIDRRVKNRELAKIQVNAPTRSGKSTVGIILGLWILNLINKYFRELAYSKKFSMNNMCRDDQEYTRKMRNPDLMYDVLVIDEQNALEKTGENATTESAQKQVFQEVQAGRYVHPIYVCPEGDMDNDTNIKLEVRNREEGMCHCYLSYKIKGSWILLGYVDFDVSNLIKNWKKVEPRFFKFLKSKEDKDRKFIEYWEKKDFYIEYMIKKYQKMELMNREGILRPRELDYAGIVLEVVEKTKDLVEIISIQRIRNPIQSYVEMEFKKQKIPVSMVGVEQTTRRVLSILTMISSLKELYQEVEKGKKLLNKGKITIDEHGGRMANITKHIDNLKSLTNIQIDELKWYKEINEKYNINNLGNV